VAATRLTIDYDGTQFAGWAKQPGLRTIQGELERALARLRGGEAVDLAVAGRTDRGVHARGQVASYPGEPVPAHALNALLPADLVVLKCEAAADGFDARRDATSRRYSYRILHRRSPSPFERAFALYWPRPLDEQALEACAAALPGEHDFTAFTPTQTEHVRFRRVVLSAEWCRTGDIVEFRIEADAFLRHMNRVLVGTMLQVARGRRAVESFVALLDGAPRAEAGPTAPPHGLMFEGVTYPAGIRNCTVGDRVDG
jgi:tRNA pseudouridine38-40 synthase